MDTIITSLIEQMEAALLKIEALNNSPEPYKKLWFDIHYKANKELYEVLKKFPSKTTEEDILIHNSAANSNRIEYKTRDWEKYKEEDLRKEIKYNIGAIRREIEKYKAKVS